MRPSFPGFARPILLLAASLLLPPARGIARTAPAATTETIVFLRHGEKPAAGLGQLDCRGLNRALALPAVIARDFGRPDAIFAPDPARPIRDRGTPYDYVRPLATIEPSAIAFGLPVETGYGYADTRGLIGALAQPRYAGALIVVAWEHRQIETIVRDLLRAHGGNPSLVPPWRGDDFDRIDIVRITRAGAAATAAFSRASEGLNGQQATCPR